MKRHVGIINLAVLLAVIPGGICPAQTGNDFDGKWIGTESLTPASPVNAEMQQSIPPPHQTIIAITGGGTAVGIVNGMCRGRYQRVHRVGDRLTFGAGDCRLSITLSKDGETLIEQGTCKMARGWMISMRGRWPVSWLDLKISGTFRRSK